MERVLITGGAGFIGSHIAEEFVASGKYKVIIVDNLSSGKLENITGLDVDFYKVDVRDRSETRKCV